MATKVNSQLTEVTIYQAAEILGLSRDTIRRWEKKQLIRGKPSQQHQRLFDLQELSRVQNKYLGKEPNPPFQVFKNQETEYSIIELFSGCGGMALGFENAGLQNRLLVEIDKDCIATLQKNRPNWQAIHQSVSEIDFKPYKNQIDIVAGGFPCQKQTERCHPEETRPLTVREYARIQTFPDEWEFAGSLSSQYKQIGNAVPVNLAYHLGRCLIKMLQVRGE